MQSLSFRLYVMLMLYFIITLMLYLNCVLKFFGEYYVTARYYIIVMLKVNTSYSFCIYVNVVCQRKQEE